MNKEYADLAGPMEDTTIEDMTGWRNTATTGLASKGIQTLDPCRRCDFHTQIGSFVQDEVRGMNVCKRIFKQDLQDIARSTVVLADVRKGSGRGTGTSMELMFAHLKNKIIILLADENDFPHPFIESIYTEKHYDLEEVINATCGYFN